MLDPPWWRRLDPGGGGLLAGAGPVPLGQRIHRVGLGLAGVGHRHAPGLPRSLIVRCHGAFPEPDIPLTRQRSIKGRKVSTRLENPVTGFSRLVSSCADQAARIFARSSRAIGQGAGLAFCPAWPSRCPKACYLGLLAQFAPPPPEVAIAGRVRSRCAGPLARRVSFPLAALLRPAFAAMPGRPLITLSSWHAQAMTTSCTSPLPRWS
jgi:hypothetical protein